MDAATCVTKDCDKPRFHEYYVCAEHFVFYAAPRYTESMLVKVEPAASSELPLYPDAPPCDRGHYESPPPEPAEAEATKHARIS
jgi:hypothetical protein